MKDKFLGLSMDEVRDTILEMVVETTMNNSDLEIIKKHTIVLHTLYDLITSPD